MKIIFSESEICDILERHVLENFDTYNTLSTAKCWVYRDIGEGMIVAHINIGGLNETLPA